ncbi:MAG: DNA-binding protein [Eubacteriales bacterium]
MGIVFIGVEEVMEALGVSKSKGYEIIKTLNNELKAKGFITICGKVSKQYFAEKFYGAEDMI